MLLQCSECGLPVSDKAFACPHCGLPRLESSKSRIKSNKKHKRLPNGFGQITEIKNRNLRNPYRAMITIGKTETGKPICKILKPQGYFRTYNDAYAALVEYAKNPYELENIITVSELYEKWSAEYFSTLKSVSSTRTISAAWKYCSSIYNMQVRDIRARHIKGCMDECPSANIKCRIKSLFNLMLDYALEYELIDKNYARTFSVSENIIDEKNKTARGHISFTDNEMTILWNNLYKYPYVDVILIQCYMGWRPQELGLLRLENINLEDWTIKGGMKTTAGTDRIVPIHTCIQPLVQKLYEEAKNINSECLINCTDTHTHRSSYLMTYDKYQKRFSKLRDILHLNPQHRAHDGRKQFVTMCKKYKVDEYAIKYMAGHAITDLTEKVYTDRNIEWLKNELEKVKK